jgi:hypothetical protein
MVSIYLNTESIFVFNGQASTLTNKQGAKYSIN